MSNFTMWRVFPGCHKFCHWATVHLWTPVTLSSTIPCIFLNTLGYFLYTQCVRSPPSSKICQNNTNSCNQSNDSIQWWKIKKKKTIPITGCHQWTLNNIKKVINSYVLDVFEAQYKAFSTLRWNFLTGQCKRTVYHVCLPAFCVDTAINAPPEIILRLSFPSKNSHSY